MMIVATFGYNGFGDNDNYNKCNDDDDFDDNQNDHNKAVRDVWYSAIPHR